MQATNNRILVSVDLEQRDETLIEGSSLLSASRYSESFRQKNPSMATVLEDSETVPRGTVLICHYNHFEWNSPYHLHDNIYSIPFDELIIGRLDGEGNLITMNGNILVEEFENSNILPVPDMLKQVKVNHGKVAQDAGKYKKGQQILWMNYSNYKVLWKWKGENRQATTIESYEIVATLI